MVKDKAQLKLLQDDLHQQSPLINGGEK